MARPRLPFNRVPGEASAIAVRPNANAISRQRDPELTIEAMQETILAGLAELQGLNMPPTLNREVPSLFKPVPGRNLFTLADLLSYPQVQDDPDLMLWSPFLNLALKSSENYPKALSRITPRMAIALTGMRISEFITVARHLAERDILRSAITKPDTYIMLRPQGYGRRYDDRLDLYAEPAQPVRNSRRSPIQQHLVNAENGIPFEEDDERKGVPSSLLEHLPIDTDVGPSMRDAFRHAVGNVQRSARLALSGNRKASPYFVKVWNAAKERDLYALEAMTITHFMTGTWRFAELYGEHLPIQEHLIEALTRGMVQWHYRAAMWRYQNPHVLLAAAIVSGISPAIFARASLDLYQRTGISFVAENHFDTLAESIRLMPPSKSPAAEHRKMELCEELSDMQKEYVRLQDAQEPAVQLEIQLATTGSSMPAWGVGDLPDDYD